jgi:hypothetical protein
MTTSETLFPKAPYSSVRLASSRPTRTSMLRRRGKVGRSQQRHCKRHSSLPDWKAVVARLAESAEDSS